MNDDNINPTGGWLERISQAFLAEPQDRKELMHVLRDAQKREILDADALAMIEGVLHVSEMRASDIMIPRSQMTVIESDSPFAKILKTVAESSYSRFPVIGDNRDEVIGILLAKDLLSFCQEGRQNSFVLKDLVRPAIFVPENKRLNILLHDFKRNQQHLAIVVDEYGGVTGLVTIEDVLEQIVGDITDETDLGDEIYIRKHNDSEYSIKAVTPIEEFNAYFQTTFSDEQFDTIGGLVAKQFGHLPACNEVIDIDAFRFTVVHSDNRRIHLLKLQPLDASAIQSHGLHSS